MRCLALAQAVKSDGGRAVFLSNCRVESLRKRVETAGIRFYALNGLYPDSCDLVETLGLFGKLQVDWIVADGYHFGPAYQQAVRSAGCRLLVIDDFAHLSEYHADLLLNQNLNAELLRYRGDSDTRLLLGTRYALLRLEFLKWRGWRREIPEMGRKVLVTMGGADPNNVTLQIIRVLQRIPRDKIEAKIVVGPANPHLAELSRIVGGKDTHLRLLTDTTDMPEVMAWADVAIAAGGSTCWELAFMGLPSVLMVLADNQEGIADSLDRAGIAVNLGWHHRVPDGLLTETLRSLLVSPQRRHQMSRSGQQVIDGGGAGRVITALRAGLVASRG